MLLAITTSVPEALRINESSSADGKSRQVRPDDSPRALDDFFTEDGHAGSGGYGEPIIETVASLSPSCNLTFSVSPLFFADFGRSYDVTEETKNGSWITFIAPQAGNYTILIGGRGGYSASYATRPSPLPLRSTSSTPVEWVELCQKQIPFLFDPAGYPKEGFSTYRRGESGQYERTNVGPDTARATIEAKLNDFARNLPGANK